VDELRYRVARAESEYESVKKDARAAYAIWLFSGIFGGHRFYLGDTTGGIIRLAVSVFTCGAGSLIGLIEGIIYLTKTDADFQRTYVEEKKGWF